MSTSLHYKIITYGNWNTFYQILHNYVRNEMQNITHDVENATLDPRVVGCLAIGR